MEALSSRGVLPFNRFPSVQDDIHLDPKSHQTAQSGDTKEDLVIASEKVAQEGILRAKYRRIKKKFRLIRSERDRWRSGCKKERSEVCDDSVELDVKVNDLEKTPHGFSIGCTSPEYEAPWRIKWLKDVMENFVIFGGVGDQKDALSKVSVLRKFLEKIAKLDQCVGALDYSNSNLRTKSDSNSRFLV